MSVMTVADDLEIHLERAIQFKIEGEYDKALEELRIVLNHDSSSARAHHELGLVNSFIGEFDDAISELQEAVRLEPENAKFHETLGLTYTMLGMYDEGREQFELIIANWPTSPEAAKAQEQLKFFDEFSA